MPEFQYFNQSDIDGFIRLFYYKILRKKPEKIGKN